MDVDSRGALARCPTYEVRRRETRYVSSVTATLQRFLRVGPIITRGVTLDISMRGMSALVCGAPRVGETVVIALSLAGANIEMLASVRHSSDARSGFEFYPLSPIAERGLQNWIQELRQHEETLFPYPYVFGTKFGND
jgi:c-di-GMP-binding flagellar brake protein YcgR